MNIYVICNRSLSGYMRGIQIANELNKDNNYKTIIIDTKDRDIIKDIKNSIILIVKKILSELLLEKLKNNHNIIIYDIIDSGINRHLIDTTRKYIPPIFKYIKYIDHVITVNEYMMKYILKRIKVKKYKLKVHCIYHHWDPNIIVENNIKLLNICYIGNNLNNSNCLFLENFDCIQYLGTNINDSDYINYNCHYNIRDPLTLNYKFKSNIKLSTAACTNSNIITTNDNSVSELLPSNYPYIIKEKVNQKSVKNMIQYVNETYDTDIWYNALSIMKDVKNKTSLINIISNYKKIFDNIRLHANLHST
jgi:hypothetical protein